MSNAIPIFFVILMWWLSTGMVLWLAGGEDRLQRGRLLLMTAVGILGFAGAFVGTHGAGILAPYIGFTSALAIWAWIEFAFLAGFVTGPRSSPCPEQVSEPERFRLAFQTISHHEFALLTALAGVGLISLQGGNTMAFWTFFVLWLMRISAKLTLFSGVPEFSVDMMPNRLSHLPSYFRNDRIGPVFWTSTLIATAALVSAIFMLVSGDVSRDWSAPFIMLTTLMGLAVLEHWLMVLPVADSALWRWAAPPNRDRERLAAADERSLRSRRPAG